MNNKEKKEIKRQIDYIECVEKAFSFFAGVVIALILTMVFKAITEYLNPWGY